MAKLLDAATTTGAGGVIERAGGQSSIFGYGTTASGSGSATVAIEVSNDATYWKTSGTLTLTLATTVTTDTNTDTHLIDAAWKYVRANVLSISGTGAAVTVTM